MECPFIELRILPDPSPSAFSSPILFLVLALQDFVDAILKESMNAFLFFDFGAC